MTHPAFSDLPASAPRVEPPAVRTETIGRRAAEFLIELSVGLQKRAMYPPGHPHLRSSDDRLIRKAGALLETDALVVFGIGREQIVVDGVSTDARNNASEAQSPAVSEEINSILSELESRSKKNRSLAIANYLIEHLKEKMKFNSRPHRSANLRVLKAMGVPSVLIELGYLSNDEDERLLTSNDWRAAKAALLADTINAFMSERQAQIPL